MRIIAHRGGPEGGLEENSLAAMERAIRLGVDGIEFDVRFHHGRWIVHHDPPPHRHAPPTLAQVVELCAGKTLLFVDVKTPVRPGSLLRAMGSANTVIASFYHAFIREIKAAGAERAVITIEGGLVDPRAAVRAARADGLAVEYRYLDRPLRGLDLYAWTVNDPREMRRVARLGAAVITDRPALALRFGRGRDPRA